MSVLQTRAMIKTRIVIEKNSSLGILKSGLLFRFHFFDSDL